MDLQPLQLFYLFQLQGSVIYLDYPIHMPPTIQNKLEEKQVQNQLDKTKTNNQRQEEKNKLNNTSNNKYNLLLQSHLIKQVPIDKTSTQPTYPKIQQKEKDETELKLLKMDINSLSQSEDYSFQYQGDEYETIDTHKGDTNVTKQDEVQRNTPEDLPQKRITTQKITNEKLSHKKKVTKD
ncbi:hypothetical protein ABPG74_008328 [Tetrahymena malaccensis]